MTLLLIGATASGVGIAYAKDKSRKDIPVVAAILLGLVAIVF